MAPCFLVVFFFFAINEMCAALTEAGQYLQTAPGVRVVVLTGSGASFCSGLDLATLKTLNGQGAVQRKQATQLTVSS